MSVVEQRERARAPVNETGMVHFGLTCCREPDFEALCGARLIGTRAGNAPLDCLVCDQMSRTPRTCPACGERMERR